MKFLTLLTILTSAVAVSAIPQQGGRRFRNGKVRGGKQNAGGAAAGGAAAGGAAAGGAAAGGAAAGGATGAVTGTVTRGANTQVFFEVGGVPGNECLTFRNNGEIVDAACVNAAADRQITPSTLNGQNVLLVQRSFSNGFRPDLVNKQVCVGFNSTHFLAQDCNAGINFVTFTNGNLRSGNACQSGHDGLAQITVDTTGQRCARLTTTNVPPTAP